MDGHRSSQRSGRVTLAEAVRSGDEDLARQIETTKDWRKGYIPLFREAVVSGAKSYKAALSIAEDGLGSLHRNLSYIHEGEDLPLREAMKSGLGPELHSRRISGEAEPVRELRVPYRGEILSGARLSRQLETWETAGVIEPSARIALQSVIDNPTWLELTDQRFVLLGAASEMGPLLPLARWGAEIVAVDLPRPQLWEQIISGVRKGAGTLHFPVREAVAESDDGRGAGADLLTEGPSVLRWLRSFVGPFTVGNFVYADGARFVLLAGAVDALISGLAEANPEISIAYFATPTDVYAVPEETVQAARSRSHAGISRKALRAVSGSRLFAPNYTSLVEGESKRWGISDSLVHIQGPNYALAKAVQRWRAIVAREEGTLSSATVAPAANTRSVVKNKMLAAAYRGAPSYGVEIFEPETSRALTAALLVHDLRDQGAAANPDTHLDHPYEMFAENAMHGGIWQLPYEPRSTLPLALLKGLVRR